MEYETDYSSELSNIGSAIEGLAERMGNIAEMLDFHRCGRPPGGTTVLPAQLGDVQVAYYTGGSYWSSIEVPILAWEFVHDKYNADSRIAGDLPDRHDDASFLFGVDIRSGLILRQRSCYGLDNWVGCTRKELEKFLTYRFNWRTSMVDDIEKAKTIQELVDLETSIETGEFNLPEDWDADDNLTLAEPELYRRTIANWNSFSHDDTDKKVGEKSDDVRAVMRAYLKRYDQLTAQSQSQKLAPTHEGEARK